MVLGLSGFADGTNEPAIKPGDFAPSAKVTISDGIVTIIPQQLAMAVKNPLTGWRGVGHAYTQVLTHTVDPGFETVQKWYIPWSFLENQASDTIEKTRAKLDALWRDLPRQNIKVIPRLVIIDDKGSYAPADLPPFPSVAGDWRESPWYIDPRVHARLGRLIQRLGQLWDNDPRVAWVEIGVEGKYGEQWGLAQMPDFDRWLSGRFSAAFKNKKILVRYVGVPAWGKDTSVYAEIAHTFPFGFYMDSFANPKYTPELEAIAELDNGTRWQTAVMTGEIPRTGLDTPPATDRSGVFSPEDVVDCIRLGHVTAIGCDDRIWIAPRDSASAAAVRRALGYHFVITQFHSPIRAEPGGNFTVDFSVKNIGSAPFYYRWPLEVRLVDEATRRTVYAEKQDQIDLRQWLPGTNWNKKTQSYSIAPQPVEVKCALHLPASLQKGIYVIAITILDPSGSQLPAIRFEIANYWTGGLHPMAKISIGLSPKSPAVDPGTFFTDSIDSTVHY